MVLLQPANHNAGNRSCVFRVVHFVPNEQIHGNHTTTVKIICALMFILLLSQTCNQITKKNNDIKNFLFNTKQMNTISIIKTEILYGILSKFGNLFKRTHVRPLQPIRLLAYGLNLCFKIII